MALGTLQTAAVGLQQLHFSPFLTLHIVPSLHFIMFLMPVLLSHSAGSPGVHSYILGINDTRNSTGCGMRSHTSVHAVTVEEPALSIFTSACTAPPVS